MRETQARKENPLKVLFQFVGEAKGKIQLSIWLAVIGEILGMAPFFAVAWLAGLVFEGKATIEQAALIAGGAALCMIVRAYMTLKSSLRSHSVSFTILKNIRCAIADKMRRVPMGVMLETPSGTFKNLLVDNVGRLEDIIAHMIPELPSNIAAPIISIILIFVLDWRMGLASLITVPLSILLMLGMMRGYSEKIGTYLRSGNEMNAALVEYISGIQVIKAFGQGGASFGKFADSVHFFHDSTMDWWRQSWFWMAGFKAVFPSAIIGTLPIGGWLYMQGQLSLPILMVGVVLPLATMPQLMKLGFGLEQLAYISSNLKPVQEFLKKPEQQRPNTPVALTDTSYVFDHAGFSYDGDKQVLEDISFEVKPGQMTAIVGPSGSGKSTIAKLMAGFWDAGSGKVVFGGQDIRQIPFAQLMSQITYVAQDNFLFDKSLKDNIRMGSPRATEEEIIQAAKAANCHEFIMGLEQGYDTMAGDAGDRLSGGERQRITLARAMLKSASVIILDEATAYADPENEAEIQQAISRLIKGKTLIVVAHRLSTIRNARQILVIEKGKLVGRGTHEELVKQSALYNNMWKEYMRSADGLEEEVLAYV